MEVTRGMSLSGDFYATEGNLMRLTLGNFDYRNNCFKDDKSKENLFFIGDVKEEFVLKKDDIITPLTEQAIGLLGSTAKIPCDDKYIQSQDIALIKCSGKLHPDFAFYLIPSKLVRNQLSAAAQQTKIRHTSPDKIKDCIVWIPEYSKQKNIGKLLSSLDDKIALNKKINAKLEAMAKRLYDYWFVQFDYPDKNGKPYKTSGGKLVWNEVVKREIPEGWEVKSVFEASDVLYGYPYATEPFDEDNLELSKKPYKVVRIRDIQNNSFSAKTTEVVDEKYKTKQNDLLVGMDGYFHMNFWFSNNDYINQRIVRFRKTLISTLILNFQIKPFIKFKETMAKGSTVGHLSDKDLKQLFIAIPNDNSISDRFDSILNMITKNNSEIQKLTELRDRLLPLLMNGQVEVGTNNSSEFCNAKLGKQATACDMNG